MNEFGDFPLFVDMKLERPIAVITASNSSFEDRQRYISECACGTKSHSQELVFADVVEQHIEADDKNSEAVHQQTATRQHAGVKGTAAESVDVEMSQSQSQSGCVSQSECERERGKDRRAKDQDKVEANELMLPLHDSMDSTSSTST